VVFQGGNSLLKSQTKSEKEKAVPKREQLDTMDDLLKQEQIAISVLDQKAQKLLKDIEEAHAEVDARVAACAKLQVDLEQCVTNVSR
jgi:peroxiredoxin family protein